MQTSDVLAIVALIISVASLLLSFYATYQDRPRLKVTSNFIEASEWGPARIHVTMINAGRRPVILRLLGGADSSGDWSGSFLEHDKGGVRLGEHERHEADIEKDDTYFTTPVGEDLLFESMWVEDSLGNRHAIPNSASYIKKLRG